jgi:sentrin-specific protease 1
LDHESRDKKQKPFDYTGWKKVENTAYTPLQMNGNDCGVFATFCAHYLAHGADPNFSQEDIPHLRRRMMISILKKRIE